MNGIISFDAQRGFVTRSFPVCIAVSDLDSDGKPDNYWYLAFKSVIQQK